ncbi:putative eka-like protein [Erysiphe neolycopersici]|uniref:Putative eka-like protein n=1 Tax=Erysiphe neolycopersici TaxID=212602 RepID=A0A420I5V6_9PEZI|nr:putative eka-like protein [Erysiphe neolycopersici]
MGVLNGSGKMDKGAKLDLIRSIRRKGVEERAASIIFPDPELSEIATVDAVEAHLVTMVVEDFEDENPKYTRSYRIHNGELNAEIRGDWKRCITEEEVSKVLEAAHDNRGHYGSATTIKRLKDYYWPRISKDTVDFILGCMSCAKHGTARRSQTQSSAKVGAPLVMLGMDFVGPLPEVDLSLEETLRVCYPQLNKYVVNIKSGEPPPYWRFSEKDKFIHIFVVIDYFSRFVRVFPCSTPDQAEAIRCLIWMFNIFGTPISIYADIGSHFTGRSMWQFLKDHKVVFTPAPSGA